MTSELPHPCGEDQRLLWMVHSCECGKIFPISQKGKEYLMAKEKNIQQVVLEVRVSNQPAIHLYEKYGFIHCGIRKGFYDFPKEDAYVMILHL